MTYKVAFSYSFNAYIGLLPMIPNLMKLPIISRLDYVRLISQQLKGNNSL